MFTVALQKGAVSAASAALVVGETVVPGVIGILVLGDTTRAGWGAVAVIAFVAAVAYVDPGNVATNLTAGAAFGYLLLWVLVVANAMAVVVQYLSAKLGLVTGQSLPELLRERLGRRTRLAYWAQAELVAAAGLALDFNTAGWRKPVAEAYPAPDLVRAAAERGIPFVLGSDAHKPEEVGHRFADAVKEIRDVGGKVVTFRGRKMHP